MTKLSSGANVSIDNMGNIWYKGDLETALGTIKENRFQPNPKLTFTSEMLDAICKVMCELTESQNEEFISIQRRESTIGTL